MSSSPNPWAYAGLASSFPNIEPSPTDTINSGKTKLRKTSSSSVDDAPSPCRILRISPTTAEVSPEVAQNTIGLEPQVLIFRYRNKIHAIDHACPHQTFPLSRGTLYDIEDFGIVLSTGITCAKHGWAFDIHTGRSDRGSYQLGIWEVDLRMSEAGEEEVWVRKKESRRIG